jgi:hypothetical protein
MDDRTAGDLSPDESERRVQLLLALDSALLLTLEMIETKNTGALIFKPPRKMEETETDVLSENYERLVNVRETALHNLRTMNVPIEDVCSHQGIVNRLALHGITSVLGMWGENPSVVHGILDQCEALGYMKGHWHMYCFVRY